MNWQNKCSFYFRIVFPLVLLFIGSSMGLASQQDPQVLRVGVCNEFAGYFRYDENGEIYGYDVEYLNKIAEHTGWQYEYVNCGTWDNALQMLYR